MHTYKTKHFIACVAGFSIFIQSIAMAAPIVNYKLVYDGKSHNYQAEEVYIKLNGTTISTGKTPPIILDGRTYVPARAVFEAMGAEIVWNDKKKEVYVIKGSDVVVLQINNKTGNKNGTVFTMDAPAKIINDSTMIPVRAVAETLGCTVTWDQPSRSVIIDENKVELPLVPEGAQPPKTEETPKEEQPETKPETKPEVKPETKPEVKPETKPEVKPEVKPETKPETKPEVKPEVPPVAVTPEINVVSVVTPKTVNDNQIVSITASGAIAKYTSEFISENRLVIDIYNANMNVSNTKVNITTSPYISSVRTAQFQTEPEKITRIVLDLKSSDQNYQISLTGDKKSIVVNFLKNAITEASVNSTAASDTLTIKAKYNLFGQVSTLSNPDRIVLDIPYADLSLVKQLTTANFKVVTGFTSQAEGNTARFVLQVPWGSEHNLVQNGKQLSLTISKGTLQNISYDSNARKMTLKKMTPLNIAGIGHNDDYLNLNYTITLPGNYEGSYGLGSYTVDDAYLKKITLSKDAKGFTTITFNESQILAYTVTEDAANVYISVQHPKEKYDKILVLDAGHGGKDPGTSGNSLTEKNINLDILTRVHALLEADNRIKVYATRLDDSYPANNDRAIMANNTADFFISIHQNSADPNPIPNGTETLYTPHKNETGGKLTSKTAASIMQTHLINALGMTNRGIKNRPDLLVLNSTKMPAILIEVCFLSNVSDASKINNEAFRQKTAQAIYDGIVEIMTTNTLR